MALRCGSPVQVCVLRFGISHLSKPESLTPRSLRTGGLQLHLRQVLQNLGVVQDTIQGSPRLLRNINCSWLRFMYTTILWECIVVSCLVAWLICSSKMASRAMPRTMLTSSSAVATTRSAPLAGAYKLAFESFLASLKHSGIPSPLHSEVNKV